MSDTLNEGFWDVCEVLDPEVRENGRSFEVHAPLYYYGQDGEMHDGHQILAEDSQDPSSWVRINGWSGDTDDRSALHGRLHNLLNDALGTGTPEAENFKWHVGWIETMARTYKSSHWDYGRAIGDADPTISDPEKQMYWCGAKKEGNYPLGYPEGMQAYPYPDQNDDEWIQSNRSQNHFVQMFGCTAAEYQEKHGRNVPDKPPYPDTGCPLYDPADQTLVSREPAQEAE